jgi:hypothetical protein
MWVTIEIILWVTTSILINTRGLCKCWVLVNRWSWCGRNLCLFARNSISTTPNLAWVVWRHRKSEVVRDELSFAWKCVSIWRSKSCPEQEWWTAVLPPWGYRHLKWDPLTPLKWDSIFPEVPVISLLLFAISARFDLNFISPMKTFLQVLNVSLAQHWHECIMRFCRGFSSSKEIVKKNSDLLNTKELTTRHNNLTYTVTVCRFTAIVGSCWGSVAPEPTFAQPRSGP